MCSILRPYYDATRAAPYASVQLARPASPLSGVFWLEKSGIFRRKGWLDATSSNQETAEPD